MKKILWPVFFLAAVLFGFLLNFEPSLAILLILGLGILAIARNLPVGVYLMTATGFFIGLEIDFSRFMWARDIPYLPSINAPLVDFFALGVFLAIVLNWILDEEKKEAKFTIPGWYWYALFLLAGLVSVFLAPGSDKLLILKAWARPQLFVFACLFLSFIAIVRNQEVLKNILRTWFGVGVFSAFFALVSLIISAGNSVWRATPFGIAGYAPFGYNHNLLAEALVATMPVALYFFATVKEREKKYAYGFISLFIGLMALLTLSRAAWLAVFIIGLLFFRHFRFHTTPSARVNLLPRVSRTPIFLTGILLPIIAYMGLFLTSNTVASSTAARWEVTKIVWWNALRAPWFGSGPGQFVSVLGENAIYVLEFGAPLDAHGFIQKMILENGFIGLLFFVLFLVSLVKFTFSKTIKLDSATLFLAQSLVLSGIAFQLFNTSYYHSVFWLPLALSVVVINLGRLARE